MRFLHFGSDWVQGAMRIARPWSLELAYTREMMAGLLLRDEMDWPRSALLVGLGSIRVRSPDFVSVMNFTRCGRNTTPLLARFAVACASWIGV